MLARIVAYVIGNIGTTFASTSIAKFLKSEHRTVAPETVLNYIKYCTEAYLFYQVNREDLQGKQILATNEKYYMADHGLREAVFGGNMKDINLILEDIVYMELLRRGYDVAIGKVGNAEIDFIATKADEKIYVQVTESMESETVRARELAPLQGIADNYEKIVLSLHPGLETSYDGIKSIDLIEWLLENQ